ncbi:LOW QUALITY PROTEIN: trans-L-3-hydroxyproline dehydratase [Paraburkholderia sp. BL6669N2]|nr:LOW QUALITY PROTEIN: trans-L-3-hydroxyproline dehydratase [Paraburkholderia sp. BL6669N2]
MNDAGSISDNQLSDEAFRNVTSGLPRLPGDTIVKRRAWLKENADEIRKALMFEPRGHADMYGNYLTEPVSPNADFGIIFLHNEGYSDHCGHGVIALSTAAVALGWVQRQVPEIRVGIDAPCGFIEAFVQWDGEHAGNVRFVNVPSFIWTFGDAFYFYADGAPHGLEVRESSVEGLIKFGAEVKDAANQAFPVQHPDIPEINHIYGTIVANKPRHEGSTQANCCVFADREVDRSPTGSGTGGRVAQLYLRGELGKDETFVNESIIGTVFKGRVLSETTVGNFKAVITEVEGNAYLCGFANWIVDERDPLTYGFRVR